MFDHIPYKRPLVIGTGGGNDLVSACLVVAELHSKGIAADVGGLCSPGAVHTYAGQEEQPVNIVTNYANRYILSKKIKKINFIDSLVPNLLKSEGIFSRVYNFSLKQGTTSLINGLESLAKERGYDGIIAVDVGGDILARGKKDPTILSPLMDFSMHYTLSQLSLPSTLIEFGLQTDGELRPAGCAEILAEARSNGIMLNESEIKISDPAVEVFQRIYGGVDKTRSGHTAVMTLKTLAASQDLHGDYRFKVQVLDKIATHSFPLTLESKYFGKVFTMDLKKLAESRELVFPYKNTLELFLKTKKIVDTKTEMDGLYYADQDNLVWLALICPQITGDERRELINYGLDNLDSHADTAILWKKDDGVRLKRFVRDVDEFLVTSDSNEKTNNLRDKINIMLS